MSLWVEDIISVRQGRRKNECTISLPHYKKMQKKVATELGYGPHILERIENASSDFAVDSALAFGRHQIKDK